MQLCVRLWSRPCRFLGGAAMSSGLLPDDSWDEFDQLFPKYYPSSAEGRPPREARRVLTGVLFTRKTHIRCRRRLFERCLFSF